MSCFMCQPETFSRVVYILEKAYSLKTFTEEQKNQLVGELYRMNQRAYNARYNESAIDCSPQYYNPAYTVYPIQDLLLACDCFLYQCNEGDVWQDMLYIYVENAVSRIYKKIAEEITGTEYYKISTSEAKRIVRKKYEQDSSFWN